MVKIKQDHDKCIGCGACASICPDNWEDKENGKYGPIKTTVKDVGCNQEAADTCPVSCIKVEG